MIYLGDNRFEIQAADWTDLFLWSAHYVPYVSQWERVMCAPKLARWFNERNVAASAVVIGRDTVHEAYSVEIRDSALAMEFRLRWCIERHDDGVSSSEEFWQCCRY